MLVFHGTAGTRATIAQIFDEGLLPCPRPWAHETTGVESHVFACTQPVGTRGGDPVHFAQRGAWRDHRAWLLVIDRDASIELRGAVPNEELERYFQVCTFASVAFEQPRAVQQLVALARRRRLPIRDFLRYRIKRTVEGLCDAPDAHSLVQFEQAYHRARDGEKPRIARSYGVRIPEDFASDAHYPSCIGCMWNLFEVDIEVPDVPGLTFSRGAWDRLDLTTLGNLLDIVGRWLAHHGDPPLTTFAALQRHHPPPPSIVPRSMWPDFVTADLVSRAAHPDTQVLLGHVPPARIVGAIDLGARDRLSALVRPTRGQTLPSNLAHLARVLVERRAASSRPIRIEVG